MFLEAGAVNTNRITKSDVHCKEKLSLGNSEYHRSWPVPLKIKHMCSMTGMETGSRPSLNCRTVVRNHKKLPCECSVRKLSEFNHNTNVGFPVYRQFCILCTNSIVMIHSLLGRRHHSRLPRRT